MSVHKHHDHSIRAKRLGEELLRTTRALANVPCDGNTDEGPWHDAWHAKDDAQERYADCVRHLPGGRDEPSHAERDAILDTLDF